MTEKFITPNQELQQKVILENSMQELISIHFLADIRRREQSLKIMMMNIKRPWETEAMKMREEQNRSLVVKESEGDIKIDEQIDVDKLLEDSKDLKWKAEKNEELFPVLATYQLALAAKLQLIAGREIFDDIETIKQAIAKNSDKSTTTASNLLPVAILVGLQKFLVKGQPIPTKELMAKSIIKNKKLTQDYALVLTEEERADFLALLPEKQRQRIVAIMDESLSGVLHHSIVEIGGDEDKQRKKVRLRVYDSLKRVLDDSKKSDKKIAASLARAMGKLGGDVRLLLLELAREEIEADNLKKNKGQEYLPHVLGVLMNEFDDWRVNDLALQLVGDSNLASPVRRNLLLKLVKRGYLPNDVGDWWQESNEKVEKQSDLSVNFEKRLELLEKVTIDSGKVPNKETEIVTLLKREKQIDLKKDWEKRLELLQKVIVDLGVVPSKEILSFLEDENRWGDLTLAQRVDKIRTSQKDLSQIKTQKELVAKLAKDDEKAMIYYILNGGEDRFNLINNYSFEKFKEMIKLISDLVIHQEPIKKFEASLRKAGMEKNQIEEMIERLSTGKFPLENNEQAYQEISFEFSENAALKTANAEIGRVLGREQLGVTLLFPLYREFLEQENTEQTKKIINKMSETRTFSDRLELISQIESVFPEFQKKAKEKLQENWSALGEKMVLEMTLDQIFSENYVPIRGEELIPRLNIKRTDLKRMKKDLLVALKGENKTLNKLRQDINKKKKVVNKLTIGLEKQTDERKKAKLRGDLNNLRQEIADLEKKVVLASDAKVSERFAHLAPKEKEIEMEKVGREIIALTEKSSSAIFTYLTMQVLGEERLREHDVTLIQEMESHLQGPFQTVTDFLTYQPTGREIEKKKSTRVALCYIDKVKRLMNMVRFADSKICCFSSNNYEMTVQHEMPNKYWVASINADPLSFVISMEVPKGVEVDTKKKVSENLGFIFGSFALDENKLPAIMLNGIYYAPGLENSEQVEIILSGVQKIFNGIPINSLAIGCQYGGSVSMPDEFVNKPVEFTRLRALDSGTGTPETKIYDDLGTGSKLNKPKIYNDGKNGSLWYKKV